MNFEQLARFALTNAADGLIPPPPAEPAHVRPDELRAAAVVGFTHERVSGSFAIAASLGGLERVRAHLGAGRDRECIPDALGALANLLMGHIQAEWRRHGVAVECSTPVVVRGVTLGIGGCKTGRWLEHASGVGGDRVVLGIDVHYEREPDSLAVPIEARRESDPHRLTF